MEIAYGFTLSRVCSWFESQFDYMRFEVFVISRGDFFNNCQEADRWLWFFNFWDFNLNKYA